jgi:uncharacterized protein
VTSRQDVQTRLTQALRAALRDRDQAATAALRSALSAIANAEAVDPRAQPAPTAASEHLAGATAGRRAAEVARKELTEAAKLDIVSAEITDREAAIRQYLAGGHAGAADRLRAEIAVLAALVSQGS